MTERNIPQELRDEKKPLDEKITKLDNFITLDNAFWMLPEGQRALLRRQLRAMRDYAQALQDRLEDLEGRPHG